MYKRMWKLWLDDQCFDVDLPKRRAPNGYSTAASSRQAIDLVLQNECAPAFMDLDHDLGEGDDALVFLRWLESHGYEMPLYMVHSQNPVGRQRIVSFMESWRRSQNT